MNHRLWHWQRFDPNLGDNLKAPEADRFFLEVAVGLTKVELAAFARGPSEAAVTPEQIEVDQLFAQAKTLTDKAALDALEAKLAEAVSRRDTVYATKVAAAWAPFVRIGPGSHNINDKPIATLADYLEVIRSQAGRYSLIELRNEVERLNSVRGTLELFYEPPAGGPTGTRAGKTATTGSQTGGL